MKLFTPIALATVLLSSPLLCARQQQGTTPQSGSSLPETTQPTPKPAEKSKSSKSKDKPLPTFLIIGTVFNENALSFPGVDVSIRRKDGKKFRWRTETNSRGEFAVRVPPGYEYEVTVRTKDYKDQMKTVDSKVDVQQRLSIEMEPIKPNQGKTGAKP
jgi:hypothetical protein